MRVVSVLPSATETVCRLGHGEDLVGRSSECDFPPGVERLPAVMRPRTLDAHRPSREIDARVRTVRGSGESLYDLDVPLLRRLAPDLLITQDLCRVCSVTEAEAVAACESAGVRPRFLSLSPTHLDGVWAAVQDIAHALADDESGERLAASLRERVRPVSRRSPPPRVAVVEWLDPPILAGLWAPEMIVTAGGEPVGAAPGGAGVRTSWSALAAEPPDLLVLSPCSFSVPRTRQELELPELAASVSSVEAPRGTFLADEAYFSRPGPRLADGVELLRHLIGGSPFDPVLPLERWFPRSRSAAA